MLDNNIQFNNIMTQNNVIDSIDLLIKQCKQIISGQNKQALRNWEEQYRRESVVNKQQRLKNTISLTVSLLSKYRILQQKSLLNYIIHYHKYSKKKIFGYIFSLINFAPRDQQCKFMLKMINNSDIQMSDIQLYLKTRSIIIPNPLNRKKKQQLHGITCTLEQWFGLISDIFNAVNRKILLQKFTEIVKTHYIEIKKDHNTNMNGSQIFLICQKLGIQFPDNFIIKEKRPPPISQSNLTKTQVLVNQVVLSELYDEDKMVGKMIAEQDKQINNIIQQRQDKMIELITQEVNELRSNLQSQRSKIRQLVDREKYYINLLKNAKSQFYKIINFLYSKRLQHKSINVLLQIFLQFQRNVQKKQSEEGKLIRSQMEQLLLIRRITEEEIKNKPSD